MKAESTPRIDFRESIGDDRDDDLAADLLAPCSGSGPVFREGMLSYGVFKRKLVEASVRP
jgi:hypothetical protein